MSFKWRAIHHWNVQCAAGQGATRTHQVQPTATTHRCSLPPLLNHNLRGRMGLKQMCETIYKCPLWSDKHKMAIPSMRKNTVIGIRHNIQEQSLLRSLSITNIEESISTDKCYFRSNSTSVNALWCADARSLPWYLNIELISPKQETNTEAEMLYTWNVS